MASRRLLACVAALATASVLAAPGVDAITEPGSLKPHHLLLRKVSAVTVQEGGQPKTITQTETREVRYTHLD